MRDVWPNARVRKNVSLIRTYHGFKGCVILQNSIAILTYRYMMWWKWLFDSIRYQTRSTRVLQVNIPSTLLVLGSPNSGSTCWLDPFQRQISHTRLVWGGKRQHWWLLSFFSLSCIRRVHASSFSKANRSIPWKRNLNYTCWTFRHFALVHCYLLIDFFFFLLLVYGSKILFLWIHWDKLKDLFVG